MDDGRQAALAVRERFAGAVTGEGSYRGQFWVELAPERLFEVCAWLRNDPAMTFDHLADVTAVHWPGESRPFELVYHLYSYERNDRLRLKTRVAEGQSVQSLCPLWKSAEWNERETFDMFGVPFEDHPDLRRILMPDEYTDFPLRKELPLYRG